MGLVAPRYSQILLDQGVEPVSPCIGGWTHPLLPRESKKALLGLKYLYESEQGSLECGASLF